VTERQMFGVVVRGLGLLSVMYGLSQWLVVAARLLGPNVPYRFPIHEEVLFGVVWVVVGTLLMRHGGWLVRVAYGSESN
jgi:hypothetical protein